MAKATEQMEQTVRKGKAKITSAKKTVEQKSKDIECQICGKKSENPVDAMTHLLDHGSSALEGMSTLIKNQKEGKVTKEDRSAAANEAADVEEE